GYIGKLCINPSNGFQIFKEQINEREEGVFEVIQDYIVTDNSPSLSLVVDFTASYFSKWSMIPAVNYNGNNWGDGLEPKGFEKDGLPWTFSYSRTSIPGATYSEGEKWSVGIFSKIDDARPAFSCSLIPKEKETIHRLIWPEEEK